MLLENQVIPSATSSTSSCESQSSSSGGDSYCRYSIHDGGQVLVSATTDYLSVACIQQWLQSNPNATATLIWDEGDTIDLPVYALRRRNAVVLTLPEAPLVN